MDTLEKRIENAEKELYFAINKPGAEWFTARLFHLMMKADPINFKKLASAYPAEAFVLERYRNNPDYLKEISERLNINS